MNNWTNLLQVASKAKNINLKRAIALKYWREFLRWNYVKEYHTNTRGEKMIFSSRPYLIDIYKDNSREIVVEKSVQCGMSEWAIVDCLSNAEKGLSILYILPKYTLRNRFVRRIDKAISRSEFYRDKIGDTDSLWQKRYGDADIVFASSETSSDFIEFSADCIIIDELDYCDQDNLLLAPDRVSASKHKLSRVISTPTYESYGIDEKYKESDQKEWNIQCHHCNEWQSLNFFVNVVNQIANNNEYELIDKKWNIDVDRDILSYCYKCGRVIQRLSEGQWIPKEPNISISGYRISKLFTAQCSLVELWEIFSNALGNTSAIKRFYNSDLGLSYTAEGERITVTLLRSLLGQFNQFQAKEEDKRYYMGMDVGNLIHGVVIDSQGRIVYTDKKATFEEFSVIMDRFDVRSCVIDIRPETRKAREFQSAHKGRILLCEYIDSNITRESIYKIDRKEGIVQAHRTQSIDLMVSGFLRKEVTIAKNTPKEYYEQMNVPVRVVEETSKGPEARWTKGNDHFFHATNYAFIAKNVNKPLLY